MPQDNEARIQIGSDANHDRDDHAGKRKPYHEPTIIEFGDIQELTQGGAGLAPDYGGTTPNKKQF